MRQLTLGQETATDAEGVDATVVRRRCAVTVDMLDVTVDRLVLRHQLRTSERSGLVNLIVCFFNDLNWHDYNSIIGQP